VLQHGAVSLLHQNLQQNLHHNHTSGQSQLLFSLSVDVHLDHQVLQVTLDQRENLVHRDGQDLKESLDLLDTLVVLVLLAQLEW
jgi:hypothetical protein